MNAAGNDHVEIVRFLLQKGVDWEGESLVIRNLKDEVRAYYGLKKRLGCTE